MSEYIEFLKTKDVKPAPIGISNVRGLPKALKAFQKDIVIWALSQGRCAIFAGTGLGKTLQQLAWADQMVKHTEKPCLILTPLAVAQQTVSEAAKFGIKGVAYAADQSKVDGRVVVTNYDRVEKFDMAEFGSIVLDESSCIKAHDSKTRAPLISHIKLGHARRSVYDQWKSRRCMMTDVKVNVDGLVSLMKEMRNSIDRAIELLRHPDADDSERVELALEVLEGNE